jgi:hypothetical protein
MIAAIPRVQVHGMRSMWLLVCWPGGNTLSLLNVLLVPFSSGWCCLHRSALIWWFSSVVS